MLLLLLFVSDEFKKGKLSSKSIFLELLGQSVFPSINYDYRFQRNFSFRIGIGIGYNKLLLYTLPITINFLTNADSDNHFEIGGGFILIGLVNYAGPLALATGNVGYRFQRKNGGSFFRIAWTPVFVDWWYKWWYGVSIGWTFKVP